MKDKDTMSIQELVDEAREEAILHRKAAETWELTLACLLETRKFALDNQPRMQYNTYIREYREEAGN